MRRVQVPFLVSPAAEHATATGNVWHRACVGLIQGGGLQVAGFDPQSRASGWVRPPAATPQNPPGWLTPVSVLRDREPTSLSLWDDLHLKTCFARTFPYNLRRTNFCKGLEILQNRLAGASKPRQEFFSCSVSNLFPIKAR